MPIDPVTLADALLILRQALKAVNTVIELVILSNGELSSEDRAKLTAEREAASKGWQAEAPTAAAPPTPDNGGDAGPGATA